MSLIKLIILPCLIIINISLVRAQTHQPQHEKFRVKKQLIHHNLSKLFTATDNSQVFGFIGDNFQRIRIKFISVKKDPQDAETYLISGKSMVKNNIEPFNGRLKIMLIRSVSGSYGVDDEYKNKGIKGQYEITGLINLKKKTQMNIRAFSTAFSKQIFTWIKTMQYNIMTLKNMPMITKTISLREPGKAIKGN